MMTITNPLVTVELTKAWGKRKAGSLVTVDAVRARAMIERGDAAQPAQGDESDEAKPRARRTRKKEE